MAQTIQSLSLAGFRSFASHAVSFDPAVTMIVGRNGAGKSNILEAITLLSTGRSFRTGVLGDVVAFGHDHARIVAKALIEDEDEELAVSILASSSQFASRSSSSYQRNGVKKRKRDVVGVLRSVLFRPEDVEIVSGTANAKKREFLDSVLIQVSPVYSQALKEYEEALRHRNQLILQLREGTASRKDFAFWDQILIKYGDVITRERARLVHFISTYTDFPIAGRVRYDHSLMTEERLHQYAVAEVGAGRTLVGPHRDTLQISLQLQGGQEPQDVATYGSRGQQRLAIIWLKVASMQFIKQETGSMPLLLLDDVFSELDAHNSAILSTYIASQQVIITSAVEELDVAHAAKLHLL